ncbi:MAG: VWA domain-containing protein [Verrucomicrobiota bacterium]
MSFVYPWVLLLIPFMLWLLSRKRARTSVTVASVQLWSSTPTGRARFLWVPMFLRRLTIVFMLVALAQPQAGTTYTAELNQGIAIQLLIDVSSSMGMNAMSESGEPVTRMEVAREMVERFIAGDGDQLQGRSNDLIGLITFARYADTRSPLTLGHDALLQIVHYLEIQERPNEDGTAYGDALAIAAARLKNLEELRHGRDDFDMDAIQSKVIILLTDGENNSGAHLPIEAAGLAKAWDCRIYVVSLGEAATHRHAGELRTAELSPAEQVLEHIARETGGIFRKAYDLESLVSVYAEIDQLERSEVSSRSFERVADWFWLPLLIAMLSLITSLTLEATCLRVVP